MLNLTYFARLSSPSGVARGAAPFLLGEDGTSAVLRAGQGEAGAALLARGHRLDLGDESMIGAATGLRVIGQLNGSIALQSRRGEGAVFTILLPVTAPGSGGLAGAPGRIALPDDTPASQPVAESLAELGDRAAVHNVIVVCTALNVERTAAYLKAGVKDVTLKPYTAADLGALLAPYGA